MQDGATLGCRASTQRTPGGAHHADEPLRRAARTEQGACRTADPHLTTSCRARAPLLTQLHVRDNGPQDPVEPEPRRSFDTHSIHSHTSMRLDWQAVIPLRLTKKQGIPVTPASVGRVEPIPLSAAPRFLSRCLPSAPPTSHSPTATVALADTRAGHITGTGDLSRVRALCQPFSHGSRQHAGGASQEAGTRHGDRGRSRPD